MGGITTSAWQIICSTEPTAVAQVDTQELRPLSAAEIHDAVTARHRRSGLAVRYEEPEARRALLRRRLRRARTPDEIQRILEQDFFEQLERSSGGDVRLALFQWLQVADFEAKEGLTVRAVAKPNFAVLESLDLTQNFTLKAFLEHRTLTLAEHDEIFRMPRQESYQIFESLGNRHLITTVPDDAGGRGRALSGAGRPALSAPAPARRRHHRPSPGPQHRALGNLIGGVTDPVSSGRPVRSRGVAPICGIPPRDIPNGL